MVPRRFRHPPQEEERQGLAVVLSGVSLLQASSRDDHGAYAGITCHWKVRARVSWMRRDVALTFVVAIDDPARFRSSKAVGVHFGLTPKKYQSGETDVTGRISKIGDAGVRTMLDEAANVILTKPVKG